MIVIVDTFYLTSNLNSVRGELCLHLWSLLKRVKIKSLLTQIPGSFDLFSNCFDFFFFKPLCLDL